jgi:hypothetical protein
MPWSCYYKVCCFSITRVSISNYIKDGANMFDSNKPLLLNLSLLALKHSDQSKDCLSLAMRAKIQLTSAISLQVLSASSTHRLGSLSATALRHIALRAWTAGLTSCKSYQRLVGSRTQTVEHTLLWYAKESPLTLTEFFSTVTPYWIPKVLVTKQQTGNTNNPAASTPLERFSALIVRKTLREYVVTSAPSFLGLPPSTVHDPKTQKRLAEENYQTANVRRPSLDEWSALVQVCQSNKDDEGIFVAMSMRLMCVLGEGQEGGVGQSGGYCSQAVMEWMRMALGSGETREGSAFSRRACILALVACILFRRGGEEHLNRGWKTAGMLLGLLRGVGGRSVENVIHDGDGDLKEPVFCVEFLALSMVLRFVFEAGVEDCDFDFVDGVIDRQRKWKFGSAERAGKGMVHVIARMRRLMKFNRQVSSVECIRLWTNISKSML